MFLEYGVNSDGGLTHISEAGRGRSALQCPYCGGDLLARKGDKLTHHFAHAGVTCREVTERADGALSLPAYDRFNLDLSGAEVLALRNIHKYGVSYGPSEKAREGMTAGLAVRGYVEDNAWQRQVTVTHKGGIPLGVTTLAKFHDVQRELIRQHYGALIERCVFALAPQFGFSVRNIDYQLMLRLLIDDDMDALPYLKKYTAPKFDDLRIALTDLAIYRAQLRRVLLASLYFVEVKHDAGTLYKIGVTNRELDQRLREISADLQPHLGAVKITPLRILKHRGNVELYFKHRYNDRQHRIGVLTEYFDLPDRKQALSDLTRLGDLDPQPFTLYSSVIERQRSAFETHLDGLFIEDRRRSGIRKGMARAAQRGVHVGRPAGTTDDAAGLLARYPAVVVALQSGLSLRKAATAAGVAVNTVRRVQAAIDAQYTDPTA